MTQLNHNTKTIWYSNLHFAVSTFWVCGKAKKRQIKVYLKNLYFNQKLFYRNVCILEEICETY